jgi:hypothetical protein
MTLLDAKEFDPEKDSRKRNRIILIVSVLLILLALGWWFRNLREELIVRSFFAALQKQDFKTAYAIWQHDPTWAQHPDEYPKYPFKEFYQDWGPSGQWGVIKTAKVNGSANCPPPSSGILVDVIVNDRVEHAQVWVEKSDHTLSYPPCELIFH